MARSPTAIQVAIAPQLAVWQRRYDVLYSIVVGEATAYLHAPTQHELLNAVERHHEEPLGLLLHLLHSCWLGGDLSLKVENDGQESPLFMAVVEAMAQHLSDWTETLF